MSRRHAVTSAGGSPHLQYGVRSTCIRELGRTRRTQAVDATVLCPSRSRNPVAGKFFRSRGGTVRRWQLLSWLVTELGSLWPPY